MFLQNAAVNSIMSHCQQRVESSGLPADVPHGVTRWMPDKWEDAAVTSSLYL